MDIDSALASLERSCRRRIAAAQQSETPRDCELERVLLAKIKECVPADELMKWAYPNMDELIRGGADG